MQSQCFNEEIELLPMSGEDASRPKSRDGRQRSFVAAVVLFSGLALAACIGATAALSVFQNRQPDLGLSAWMLLESPELVNIVTDHHMEVRRSMRQPVDFEMRSKTHAHVGAHLRKLNADFQERSPQGAAFLASAPITEDEKQGLLHLVRHVGDRRLAAVGRALALAKAESASMDVAAQKHYIAEKMRPREAELRHLHRSIFHGLPARVASAEGRLHGTRSARRLQTQPVYTGYTSYTTVAPDDLFKDGEGMLGELQTLLEAFKAMFSDQLKKMNIPILSDALSASDDIVDVAKCALGAGESLEATQTGAPSAAASIPMEPMEKLMECPAELSTSGMDQLGQLLKDLGADPCDFEIGSDC